LLLVVLLLVTGRGLVLEVSALHTSSAVTSEGRSEGEVDVLLAVDANQERRLVAKLPADSDVSLLDEAASVVDGLRHTKLVYLSLQTALEHFRNGHGKSVIELSFAFAKKTKLNEPSEEGLTLEDTLLVLLTEGKEVTCGGADLGHSEHNPPHLTLVPQTVLTNELELVIQTRLLVRSPGCLGSLRV